MIPLNCTNIHIKFYLFVYNWPHIHLYNIQILNSLENDKIQELYCALIWGVITSFVLGTKETFPRPKAKQNSRALWKSDLAHRPMLFIWLYHNWIWKHWDRASLTVKSANGSRSIKINITGASLRLELSMNLLKLNGKRTLVMSILIERLPFGPFWRPIHTVWIKTY